MISVLKKRDFSKEEIVQIYEKSKVTLLILLCKMGRFSHFDKIIDLYSQSEIEDFEQLKQIVVKLWTRCSRMHSILLVLRDFFRNFLKHKTCYETLAELGIYMQKPGFNVEKT